MLVTNSMGREKWYKFKAFIFIRYSTTQDSTVYFHNQIRSSINVIFIIKSNLFGPETSKNYLYLGHYCFTDSIEEKRTSFLDLNLNYEK